MDRTSFASVLETGSLFNFVAQTIIQEKKI